MVAASVQESDGESIKTVCVISRITITEIELSSSLSVDLCVWVFLCTHTGTDFVFFLPKKIAIILIVTHD